MIGRCKKSLGAGKEVIIDASTINAIFSRLARPFSRPIACLTIFLSVVALSESEPYGVRGGSLVVLFAPNPNSKDTPVKVLFQSVTLNHLQFSQIGHFPMDPSTVATFELHLTIQVILLLPWSVSVTISQASMAVTTRVCQTLTNFVRKIGGKPTQVPSFNHPISLENNPT